jgi:hypothetical protein
MKESEVYIDKIYEDNITNKKYIAFLIAYDFYLFKNKVYLAGLNSPHFQIWTRNNYLTEIRTKLLRIY